MTKSTSAYGVSLQPLYSNLTSCSRLGMTLVDSLDCFQGLVPLPIPLPVITPSWLVCLCNPVYVLDGLIKRIQFEVPIDRNGEFSDGKEKTVVTWRKRPLRAGGRVSQNWAEDRSCNHAGPFMVMASIAGAHLGSGGLQCGSPLAQDLGLIRTRPEKKVGCDYRGIM